ncbi:MAG TPA: exo-alpha-sialidase [Opitutaceae bacterium]|nr:exo-alpha-sialidase [Opitutaceae bacterium]
MKSALLAPLLAVAAHAAAPVAYLGPDVATPTADGGLRPVVGVQNIQVYRASRTASAHADGLTDTYTHAPMLCHWRGRFYVLYLSGPRSEHEAPCVTSLTSSADGVTWDAPKVIFPAFALPDGTQTIAHQRMGFYVAPDGRLLALGFYGRPPSPNDGTGLGRAVREVFADGSCGPIHFIRPNAQQPFPAFKLPYPPYRASPDAGFVAACEALLADKLMTAQWWEEEMLDESGFYRVRGKALSYVTRPDGSVLGIWKNRLVATTSDRGQTWSAHTFAENVPNNGSKYWLQRMADGRYGLVLNPTNRNRYPLAIMTSPDAAKFEGLLAVHGELPDQRFGGYLKNMGPQYVRGIVEGNGTPPDTASAFYLTYSVNKEDIWFARVPVPVSATAAGPVVEDFEAAAPGTLPAGWNVYTPLWAPVRVSEADGRRALSLRDEDPYDYARAVRVFPATHGVKVSFDVLARQANARLEIDLEDGSGLRPVRLAFGEDGRLWACHEAQWMDAGAYTPGRWHRFELEIPANPEADRCAVTVDGKSPLPRPAFFTDPVRTVERLSFRTGPHRPRGYGGRDLPGADHKTAAAEFLVDNVSVTPVAR